MMTKNKITCTQHEYLQQQGWTEDQSAAKSLFGCSYRGDGILSATKCIFNIKTLINIGTS